MRNFVCKSTFSVLVLFAVLSSVFRLNIAFASTPAQKTASFEHLSLPKPQKHFTTYFSELKEYTIENGEELDDESDESEEITACVFRDYLAIVFGDYSESSESATSLFLTDNFSRKNTLPLFIEFENFRL
jgi:hypothetical protein